MTQRSPLQQSKIKLTLDTDTKSLIHILRVPLTASGLRHCESEVFVKASCLVPVGALIVKLLRNDRGAEVCVVLPNGYCFPTGRTAPVATWFEILKLHLRSWAILDGPSRIVRIANEGVQLMEAQITAGKISEHRGRLAVDRLLGFRAEVVGEGEIRAEEETLRRLFLNWMVETSHRAGISQTALVEIVRRSLDRNRPIDGLELDSELLISDPDRFVRLLDL